MENVLVNKVSESGLITIDLAEFHPGDAIAIFDIKDYLFRELLLREKDFRNALVQLDWEQYRDKNVGITCSNDAIIPMWAYMLITSYLQPVAKAIVYGNRDNLVATLFLKNLARVDGSAYTDKRVVIKGCGDINIPEAAYVEITSKLRPYVKSIMYGEPCSTVPIFKKR
ncbi:DUF2480 family protein [Segetibacter sp. 3557_3]|uniref:DUF2480 family protein n=1 Tax=Segetibacter sp. 3557_3 TaxID=2547429 RepID=UPI0010583F29|nr:DUF2480 family protein [Segetibacter sp. 3557_3]TDH25186.1 DUF2480 family protein [Segetibacter sp. 3557_3]